MTSALKSIYKTNTSYKTYWFYFVLFALILNTLYFIPGTAHAATLSRPPSNLNLVGYWPMDEGSGTKVVDISGNRNTGSIFGSTWINGKRGKALSFNGSSDKIVIPNSTSLNISGSEITNSVWFKASALSGKRMLLTKGSYGYHWNYGIGFSGSSLIFRHNNGDIVSSAVIVPLNTWNNFTAVYSGGNDYFYFNGVLVDTKSDTGWQEQTGSYQLTLGAAYTFNTDSYSEFFNGTIDDVRIYSRALTATEISRMYYAGQVTRKQVANTGLVGYWSLNDGAGNRAVDSSGNGNNGTLTGSTIPTWTDGKHGKAVRFDGTDDYIDAGNQASVNLGANNFTISAWINPNGSQNRLGAIVDKYSGPGFFISLNGFIPRVFLNDNGGLGYIWQDCGSTPVPNARWSLVSVVFNRINNAVCYINGLQVGTVDISSRQLSINTARNLYIGHETPDNGWFKGVIDDVRIYNRALSTTEIQALYKQTETAVNASQTGKITNGLVGYWPFNGLDIATTTAYDRSGQGNNGTIFGAKATQGKSGQALSFNGSSNYVEIPNNISLNPNVFTISAWVKSNTPLWNDYGFIVSKRDAYIIHPTANSKIVNFYMYTNTWVAVSCTPSTITEWGLYTMTWDGTAIKCFINGIQGGINTPGGSVNTTDTGVIQIGKDDGLARYFNGSIDEVRIYNRALSADEIKKLYNMSK